MRAAALRPAQTVVLVLLAGACARAPREEPDELPARREDVTAALQAQFELILERRRALAGDPSEAAARERERLGRLAGEIAFRLARLDPGADPQALLAKLEQTR